jgi:hypothetical protein
MNIVPTAKAGEFTMTMQSKEINTKTNCTLRKNILDIEERKQQVLLRMENSAS